MQHMLLSLSTRAHVDQSVHSVSENCSHSRCMYTMYPPEDEHLWLETYREI